MADKEIGKEKKTETYFFDTYALVEILKGTPSYEKYKNSKIVTTLLNLMEVHYSTMRELGVEKAVLFFNELKSFTIEFSEADILSANYFRYNQNKTGKKFSYIDDLGYVIALKKGIKFLTGDEEFKDVENVEFVKG
jgi:predicted nucleic acid-binding protein